MFNTLNTFAIRTVNAAAAAAVQHPAAAAATGATVGTAAAFGTYKAVSPLVPKAKRTFKSLGAKARTAIHNWASEETKSPKPDAPAATAAAA